MPRRRSEVGGDKPPERKPRREIPDKPKRDTTTVPHDPVNEIVMLAAVMVDTEAANKYLPIIPPESFFGQGHAQAWAILQRIQQRGLHYDPATVQQMSAGAVSTEMLEAYAAERPRVPPNIRYHAECISWDRARVEAVRGPVSAFLEAIKDPSSEPSRVRALARAIGDSFDGVGDRRFLRDNSTIIREHKKELEDRRMGRAIYPYGLEGFDFYGPNDPEPMTSRLIPGMAPGKISVVVGLSGSGKSTVTARIALEQARNGRSVLYGAWEQTAGLTLELVAAMSLGWDRSDLMTGKFTEKDQDELLLEMERLGQWLRFLEVPYEGNDKQRSNSSNLNSVHQYISDVVPDVFIADLFKRALTETKPDDEEIALWKVQSIAQKTQTHVVLVHQLRLKDVESRPDQRPTRESVKGNSAWIDVADTLIGWYRPSLHKNVPDDTIQAIILKQRYGEWPLAVEFDWNARYGSVDNGRSIEYERPGQMGEGMDGFLGESFLKGKRKRSAT